MENHSDQGQEKRYSIAIRRPVTMAMLFLTLVVFGWKSYEGLALNLMPDISYPTLTVRTEYEGAAPEDVEKLLTRPLEETLSIVSGLVEVSSISSAGLSEIILEFTWDSDMNTAQSDVRDRLDLFDPPEEVTEKPVILRYDPTLDPVMRVAVTGRDLSHIEDTARREQLATQELMEIRDSAERNIKLELEGEPGIAQVEVKGGREEEIQILVDTRRLKNVGLSLQAVTNALAQQNINLSGGILRDGKSEYLVRTVSEYEQVPEIRDTIVGIANGRQVRVSDVADVTVGQKDRDTIVRIGGIEAVEMEIFKWGDANTVEVCNKLKHVLGFEEKIGLAQRLNEAVQRRQDDEPAPEEEQQTKLKEAIQDYLPEYASLTLVSDQSRFIVGSINEVRNTALMGGLLALIVLFFFLRDVKSTAITGVAIPISIIATFIPMYAGDISLNIMSLGGLALGVGMLVDNSIVVIESIFRCLEEGDDAVDAADRGTREVGGAVIASTLTTVAVFFPIVFVEGIAGQLFRDLALTVTFSLLASLLVALYLIPMIASRRRAQAEAGREVIWMARAYRAGRREGDGRAKAVMTVPLRGIRYAVDGTRATVAGNFALVRGFLHKTLLWEKSGLVALARRLAGLALIPFVCIAIVALTAAQLVIQLCGAVLQTVLFFLLAIGLLIVRAVSFVFHVVLWLPLKSFDVGFGAFRRAYATVLRGSLRISPVILLAVLILAGHAIYMTRGLGQELIPPLKQGEFTIRMEAPPGTRIEETARRAEVIEQIAAAVPEVDTVTTEVGTEDVQSSTERGENIAQFSVLLKDPSKSVHIQDAIMEGLRSELAHRTSDVITLSLPTLFSFKTAIELQILGDDLPELRRVGQEVLAAVRNVGGVKDAELSMKAGYPEVIIELDRDLLASKNLAPETVAQRLRSELQGDVATRFNRAGNKIDIRVRTAREDLRTINDLKRLSVVDGYPPIPLESVAQLSIQEGPSEIRRVDQRQVALLTANVSGRDLGTVAEEILAEAKTVDVPLGFDIYMGGQNRELEVSYNSLVFALGLAVFLVYVVMACQFESIWHPALVMFSVPLAFVGVVYALYLLDINVSIVVFIGGIVLAGIVVNNAIVLVDYINQLRRRGMPKREAVVLAGEVRLRPILMTTLTTVLGLLPMALWTGEGAEMRQPLAITVMAGLSSATVLTLMIIPMAYDVFGGRDK